MTTKEWAEKLNGREYGDEIDNVEAREAKADGVVIVFGASDDLMEFRGAIDDEIGACDGGTAFVSIDGLFGECACDEYERRKCKHLQAEKAKCRKVEAVWEPKDDSGKIFSSWEIRTDIPHETFDIMEEGELYCRGVVFYLGDAVPIVPC